LKARQAAKTLAAANPPYNNFVSKRAISWSVLLLSVFVFAVLVFVAVKPHDDLAELHPYIQGQYARVTVGSKTTWVDRQINLQNLNFPQAKALLDKMYSHKRDWYWDNSMGAYRYRKNLSTAVYVFGRMDADRWQGQKVTKKPDPNKLIPRWDKPHIGPPYVYLEEIQMPYPTWKERLAMMVGAP